MKIQEYLDKKSKAELAREILTLCRKIPEVKNYYSDLLASGGQVLDKYKKLLLREFFPTRGLGHARAGVVREIIADFKKVSNANADLIELLIFHVELGVKFTLEYGDISERFYSSVAASFESALKLVKKEKLFEQYHDRSLKIVQDTKGMGWGFHDDLSESYYLVFKRSRLIV